MSKNTTEKKDIYCEQHIWWPVYPKISIADMVNEYPKVASNKPVVRKQCSHCRIYE